MAASKRSEQVNDASLGLRDWFAPVVGEGLSVIQSLDVLDADLSRRLAFVKCLRRSLWDQEGQIDSLSSLKSRAERITHTLNARLGITDPARPAAWFRPASTGSFGIFTRDMIADPMLPAYDLRELDRIEESVRRAWAERSETVRGWPVTPSVWGQLFALNHEFDTRMKFAEPFSGMRLDTLPEKLPEDLSTPILRGYLTNVRANIAEVRQILDGVFGRIFLASEKMWLHQRKLAKSETQPAGPQQWAEAKRIRDDLRARREAQRTTFRYSSTISAALDALRLDRMPADEHELRRRYLELARELHPDRNEGRDDEFKKVAQAYDILCKAVRGPYF